MNFFERLAELERRRATFAIATVVARRSPVSSHLGDRAIIYSDGRVDGFVGGACSRELVRRHALEAIRSSKPRLLRIRPDVLDDSEDDVVVVPMGCASEGAVDVYIEPHGPLRRLVVIGFTPVAEALARLARALEYDVVRVVAAEEARDVESDGVRILSLEALREYLAALETADLERLVVIVASQGQYDEAALRTIVAERCAFVGLLASRKRAAAVKGALAQEGVSNAALERIQTPVGLDIGARSAGEVAVSILAQIIASTPVAHAEESAARFALDPVCGMEVEIANALHRLEREGAAYYFCSAHCRATFGAAAGTP